jgi:hypothetical protein
MALKPADIAVVSRLLGQALALPVEEWEGWFAALPAEHQRHVGTLRDVLALEAKLELDSRLDTLPKLARDDSVAQNGPVVRTSAKWH